MFSSINYLLSFNRNKCITIIYIIKTNSTYSHCLRPPTNANNIATPTAPIVIVTAISSNVIISSSLIIFANIYMYRLYLTDHFRKWSPRPLDGFSFHWNESDGFLPERNLSDASTYNSYHSHSFRFWNYLYIHLDFV